MEGRILLLHALTPLHSGIGQAVDVIDLPIAREKATTWPYLPGSSIKGVLRDSFFADSPLGTEAFGPETKNADDSAGSLLFCDGRLLALPVRAYYGTFAWVTCPAVLTRLRRDMAGAGMAALPALTAKPDFTQVGVCKDSALRGTGSDIFLEDYDLKPLPVDVTPCAQALAQRIFATTDEQTAFTQRFAVVNDDLFTFLAKNATEITARIAIEEESKTVKAGALWYEESVPAEAIFWALLLAQPRGKTTAKSLFDVLQLHDTLLQLGGHAGVGRGVMRARFSADGGGQR